MIGARAKRLGPKLLLSLGVTLIALLVAELGYRLRFYGTAGLSPRAMNSLHHFGESGLLRPAELPGLRYQLRPNLNELYRLARFETNSLGLRDEEYPLEKPAGTFRIAVVGDSFTMGSGVELEDAYHSVLERLLDERPGDQRYECINFGVAGYGLGDYEAVVEHLVGRYEPDLILVGLSRTDRMRLAERSGPYVPLPPARAFLRWFSLEAAQRNVRRVVHGVEAAGNDPDRVAPGDDPANPLGEATMRYLKKFSSKLKRSATSRGLPLLIVHLHAAAPARGGESRVGEAYRRTCESLGLPYFDASTLFEGLDATPFHLFPDDPHPNAEGHAIFAHGIHSFLLESKLLDG